jgi:hypothetical protein
VFRPHAIDNANRYDLRGPYPHPVHLDPTGSRLRPRRGREGRTRNSQKATFAANIDETVAPFLGILRDAGRERERAALEFATEIAKQMTPFSVVAFALVAGFFIGRRSNDQLYEAREAKDVSSGPVQLPQSQDPEGQQVR